MSDGENRSQKNISIRALLAEGDLRPCAPIPVVIIISIRALLAEGDTPVLAHTAIRQIISIRALLAEGDSTLSRT